MTIDADYLYGLLPAVHRVRDEQTGGALKALLAVLAEQAAVVEADIDRLYKNWFIETCEPWVVPYIGDLLGVRGLRAIAGTPSYSPRSLVADTLRLRRRKGTLPALEQLTTDTTGWPAHAVEFFQLLATTQHVKHVRPSNLRTPDLRNSAHLELLDGPFDDVAHTAQVRALPTGRYNIPNVGLFVWRLQEYPLRNATARPADGHAAGLYTFDPLGRSITLFNLPATLADGALTSERNVPAALRRRPLFDELEERRAAALDGSPIVASYFGDSPVLAVTVDDQVIPPERVYVCSLLDIGGTPVDWPRPPTAALPTVSVDPELGRIALPPGTTATRVQVAYAYGFSGDVGGGPYDRRGADASDTAAIMVLPNDGSSTFRHWQVTSNPAPGQLGSLGDALNLLGGVGPGGNVLIEILDDASYPLGVTLDLPGVNLVMQAANQRRPALLGDLTLKGDAATRVTLNGFLIDGALTLEGPLGQVTLAHCTLNPEAGGLGATDIGDTCALALARCVVGRIRVDADGASLGLRECIVDPELEPDAGAIIAPKQSVTVDRSTVLGSTQAQTLSASNSLFTGTVTVTRRQEGCVRFSYVPPGSSTPRRFRCQPDLAVDGLDAAQAAAVSMRLTPAFTSEHFASPAYAQLSSQAAVELRTGADDGAEMGVWNFLQQPQREANLRNALDEYLRAGLAADLIYVT